MAKNGLTILLSLGDDPVGGALAAYCAAMPGVAVLRVPELYHLPDAHPLWNELAALSGEVICVSRLHPRPAEWLLRAHGIGVHGIRAIDLRTFPDVDACRAAIRAMIGEYEGASTLRKVSLVTSERWYPVIDGSRCVHCRHCLQFCLFGVYEEVDGKVVVRNPDQCKPGCPACSRICPHGAIIFPLCAQDEAIAGAPGRFMEPDLAARKMFYLRTGHPCPRCGSTDTTPARAVDACPECGRAITPSPPSPVHDEIDALIDALERM